MCDIDTDVLISSVKVRPVLWDKTLDIYKDRNANRRAWREVCLEVNQDFEELEDKEKGAFGELYICLLYTSTSPKVHLCCH